MSRVDLFLNRVFDGLEQGIIYGGIALALVLIFKATTLINFAQGEMAMFGRVPGLRAQRRAGPRCLAGDPAGDADHGGPGRR